MQAELSYNQWEQLCMSGNSYLEGYSYHTKRVMYDHIEELQTIGGMKDGTDLGEYFCNYAVYESASDLLEAYDYLLDTDEDSDEEYKLDQLDDLITKLNELTSVIDNGGTYIIGDF